MTNITRLEASEQYRDLTADVGYPKVGGSARPMTGNPISSFGASTASSTSDAVSM
jgi:hypothetical protein